VFALGGKAAPACRNHRPARSKRAIRNWQDRLRAIAGNARRAENASMLRIVVGALALLVGPALAQDQPGNQSGQTGDPGQAEIQVRPSNVERIETPQGAVTVVRPTPRAQPAAPQPMLRTPAPRARVNPDPVPPRPGTPFLGDQPDELR
jgi:hypothetical protein